MRATLALTAVLLYSAVSLSEVQATQKGFWKMLSSRQDGFHAVLAEKNQTSNETAVNETEKVRHQNESYTWWNETFYSGYLKIHETQDLFYTVLESRGNKTADPLLIWMRGQPGCSATEDLIEESSAHVWRYNESLGYQQIRQNPLSWNNFTNLMFLDFPANTGYSFLRQSTRDDPWSYSSDAMIRDFIHFMKQFYIMHPQYVGRELYLAAQDFSAGQYLPKFVAAIEDLKNGTFIDEDFDIKFLDLRDKEWNTSFNV